jgi:long-chain acyl-CoA synthetase
MAGPTATQAVPPADPSAPSFPALFQSRAKERGSAPAMFFQGGGRWVSISWTDYAVTVKRFTNALLSWGVGRGDTVAIWSANRPEWHVADLATSHAAGASVGLYPTLAPAQVEYQLSQSEAKVIVVEKQSQASQVAAMHPRLPTLVRVVVLDGYDGSLADWGSSWTDALSAGEAFGRTRPGLFDDRWRGVGPEDLYTLIYTSGTTGPSKGAIITHRNFVWTVDRLLDALPMEPDDRLVSYLPLSHIAERVATHGRHVKGGCRVYFCHIDNLIEDLKSVHPTFFFAVPRIYEKTYAGIRTKMGQVTGARRALLDWALHVGAKASACKQRGERPGPLLRAQLRLADRLVFRPIRARLGLDQVKVFSVSTAPVSGELLNFFDTIGIEIDEIFGLTEVTGPASLTPPGSPRFGTVGVPLPGTEIKLAADGEILVRGPHVFAGYYRMPEETAAALHDGWLSTGDVGTFDANGYLRITDRKKDLIKTAGGKYVAPSQIEVGLKRNPLISQAVVIGDRRPFVSALLTLNADTARQFAKQHGLEGLSIVELTRAAAVQAELQRAVDEANASLSHAEQVKRWAVLPGDFVIGDELGPTAKVKRKVVAEKYAKQIEELYPTSDRAAS